MSEEVLKEFTGLTNSEAYVNIFSKRMMQPVPYRVAEFMGCDQRIDMLPTIQKIIKTLPSNSQIFDVGAGAGDIVDFALQYAPSGTTINIEEPNPILLKAYQEKIKKYSHLKLGKVYGEPLQHYYTTDLTSLPHSQDLILSVHMIYHLTDFKNFSIDPEADLIKAITFLYGLLNTDGKIFIVYADLLENSSNEALCGIAEKYFRQKFPNDPYADNLISIYQARNNLLGPKGNIDHILKKYFPESHPTLHSEHRQTYFFGKTLDDIAVLALATELCPSNDEPFEIEKLKFCIDYVKRFPKKIGLEKETRQIPQYGMWRANEPQVIATITKK